MDFEEIWKMFVRRDFFEDLGLELELDLKFGRWEILVFEL